MEIRKLTSEVLDGELVLFGLRVGGIDCTLIRSNVSSVRGGRGGGGDGSCSPGEGGSHLSTDRRLDVGEECRSVKGLGSTGKDATTHPWRGTIHWQIPHTHTCSELKGKMGMQNNTNVVFFLAETTAAEESAHINTQHSRTNTTIVR